MKISRSEPGFPLSVGDPRGIAAGGVRRCFPTRRNSTMRWRRCRSTSSPTANSTQIMKGEKTAREIKPTPRVDKVAPEAETKPEPPLARGEEGHSDAAAARSASAAAADRRRCAADAAQASRRAAAKAGAAAKACRKATRARNRRRSLRPRAPEPDKKEPEKKEARRSRSREAKAARPHEAGQRGKGRGGRRRSRRERLKIDEVAKLLDQQEAARQA